MNFTSVKHLKEAHVDRNQMALIGSYYLSGFILIVFHAWVDVFLSVGMKA